MIAVYCDGLNVIAAQQHNSSVSDTYGRKLDAGG
jgi:hypothetical protein